MDEFIVHFRGQYWILFYDFTAVKLILDEALAIPDMALQLTTNPIDQYCFKSI
jgi:hypothetical protein